MQLVVSVANHLSMCPFYLAYESGYFEDEGFDPEVVKDTQSAQSVPLLAGGKLDVAFAGVTAAFVNAAARGVRVKLVAAREVISPTCGTMGTIYVSRRAYPNGVRSMRELRGARIGLSPSGPGADFLLGSLLEHEGMRESDIVLRKLPAPESVAAIRAGRLDGFLSKESDFSPELRDLGLAPGPSIASFLPDFQFSYIAFGRRLLDGGVETGARFLRAYFRGAREFLNGRTPRFLDNFAKQNNLDATLLRQMCRGTFVRDGAIRLDDLRRHVQWFAAHHFCPAGLDAATLVDTRFLDAAHAIG
jgi:hypothetical protein